MLQLPGYSEEEKTLIAQKYIIPKQLEAHGLAAEDLTITDAAIRRIIADYTREAGLRNLEREIAAICRKVARRRAEGQRERDDGRARRRSPSCSARPRFFRELADRTGIPGVATGLAWTPTGGEILFIEATGMPGKGGLTLDRPARRVDARERPGGHELPAEPRQAAGARRLAVQQDRRAHPRPGRRRAQGRPLGRRGDRRGPDQPVPRHGRSSRTWR